MCALSRRSFLATAAAGGLAHAAQANRLSTGYQPTKESLNTHPLPDWFHDGKLGIFLHWGLYSIPGFAPKGKLEDVLKRDYAHAMVKNPYAEDYWNAMRDPTTPTAAFHREHYGERPYEEFRAPFRDALKTWDPDGWATEFRDAGGHYVVLTAKYADGFCLWPTKYKNPFINDWFTERDVVGDLARAVRRQGMRFGAYFSGGLDWSWHKKPQRTLGEYIAGVPGGDFPAYSEHQFRELIDRYELDILWNDITWCHNEPALFRFFADYYNRIPSGVVNDRFSTVEPTQAAARPVIAKAIDAALRARVEAGGELFSADRPMPPHADFVTPEWVQFTEIRSKKWEVCRGMAYSWAFNRTETEADHIKPDELVFNFIDAVSKNGNMLLNVGPDGDAKIPPEQLVRLRALGEWIKPNGGAIFGTRPWKRPEAKTADGLPVRITTKGDTLNLIIWGRPRGSTVRINDLTIAGRGKLLANGSDVTVKTENADLVLNFARPLTGELGPVVAIERQRGGKG